ncbi:ABC transporter substrate-binding protein [Sulfitobacter sp. S190]|uniref:ABC transporter substrate-binding protein n=1 Tax=Sulfitobacter sp. S190 TaxID=2867022 RepID=UPI0021A6AF0B|nr:ABC transporter substrate-binding protein [Sulfitobacter sp. S190]UWR22506.1 peptide ABC transporter substrate-binding protein [Sulfitobacter sp. S190]
MTRRGPMDRRALFASGAAAALLAATGISAGPLPQRGGQLRLALSGAARSDDWISGDGLFMQVARQGLVFETLTEVAADGTLRAELATGWTASPDAREWRFDLREDAVFHDGTPMTAQDVAASLSACHTVYTGCAHSVHITCDTPDPSLPFKLADVAHVIRPAHAPDAGIGTGLYAVERFRPGQQLITRRVARHHKDGRAGWFDRVELVSIPSAEVRAQAIAEYMVDAADLEDTRALQAFDDIAVMPGQAVSRGIATPLVLSEARPLDNLRAPQRWWVV